MNSFIHVEEEVRDGSVWNATCMKQSQMSAFKLKGALCNKDDDNDNDDHHYDREVLLMLSS